MQEKVFHFDHDKIMQSLKQHLDMVNKFPTFENIFTAYV